MQLLSLPVYLRSRHGQPRVGTIVSCLTTEAQRSEDFRLGQDEVDGVWVEAGTHTTPEIFEISGVCLALITEDLSHIDRSAIDNNLLLQLGVTDQTSQELLVGGAVERQADGLVQSG